MVAARPCVQFWLMWFSAGGGWGGGGLSTVVTVRAFWLLFMYGCFLSLFCGSTCVFLIHVCVVLWGQYVFAAARFYSFMCVCFIYVCFTCKGWVEQPIAILFCLSLLKSYNISPSKKSIFNKVTTHYWTPREQVYLQHYDTFGNC